MKAWPTIQWQMSLWQPGKKEWEQQRDHFCHEKIQNLQTMPKQFKPFFQKYAQQKQATYTSLNFLED